MQLVMQLYCAALCCESSNWDIKRLRFYVKGILSTLRDRVLLKHSMSKTMNIMSYIRGTFINVCVSIPINNQGIGRCTDRTQKWKKDVLRRVAVDRLLLTTLVQKQNKNTMSTVCNICQKKKNTNYVCGNF